MPKRSNTFQKIILAIQRQLAMDAEVYESALLRDRQTDSDVEVDILIKSKIIDIPIIIGIECRDRSRPSTVEWVREMHAKHEQLPIDKTILISRSGFTKQAIKKAEANGIEIVNFEQAPEHDWKLEFSSLKDALFNSYKMRVTGGTITFKDKVDKEYLNQTSEDKLLYSNDFKDGVTLKDYGEICLSKIDLREQIIKTWISFPTEQQKMEMKFNLNIVPNEIVTLQIKNELFEISEINYIINASFQTTALNFKSAKYKGLDVAFTEVDYILPHSPDDVRKAVLTFIKKDDKIAGIMNVSDYDSNGDKEIPFRFFK